MKLSTKGRYAVMAMVDLAKQSEGGPVVLADIAERQHISLSYLEQLFGRLRKGAQVKSVRGPGGGYRLNRKPAEITLCEVVECLDGPLNLVDCIDEGHCELSPSCIIKSGVTKLAEDIRSVLTNATLADLAEGSPDHQPHRVATTLLFPV